MKLGNLLCMFWGANDMLTYCQMLALCVCAVYQSIAGSLTVGDFIVFMSYNAMLIWPVRGLGRSLSEAGKAKVSLGRLIEILEEPPEKDAPGSMEPDMDGDIAFETVRFAYPGEKGGEPVLRGVSFVAEKGKTLGVLGGTGSGKTTAAALLCRLYDLEEGAGRITVGGADIKKIKRAWLRKHIGIVLQEPFLFSRTIGENIAALSKEHSAESIARAARISYLDDSVERFAQGFDTIVGERGVTLSGGQKQRVAIARAILNNPPIMIFDDSLSAVDTETDTKIRAALGEMTHGVTTIIIAHRITSISKADKILVLEKGRVAEIGTHGELLQLNGIYRRVYDLQSSIEDEIGEEGERA
jgi:ATP-binding cassette subfamily B protein